MKGFKKNTAILLICVLSVVFVLGLLFGFVPMNFGKTTFVSFSGSVGVTSDVKGGIYGEYDIAATETPSKSALLQSMSKIKEVFDDYGYKNVEVYALGTKKIRVEVSYPYGSKNYSDVLAELSRVATGAFQLRNEQTVDDDTIILDGATCVESVNVYTNNSTKYMTIKFNSKGQEKYKELLAAGTTIYIALGDYTQSQTVQKPNDDDYSQLTLSGTDYENLVQFEWAIILGCMKVELNPDTVLTQTKSATLTAGESASSPDNASYYSSTAYVVAVSSVFIVLVLGLALFAIKFGPFAILVAISAGFGTIMFLLLLLLTPSIQIGLSGFFAIAVGMGMIYVYTYQFASRVKGEYELGKSYQAALEVANKTSFKSVLMGGTALFLSSLIMYFLSFGELASVTAIFAIISAICMVINLLIIPLLVKICLSFNKIGRKLFMLKKRTETELGEAR
ncbi:MAG: hypothetical protein IJ538_01750 [Clostridia bacterium]|nr:hypothetical protein [Clostridia bacterium]